jgi:hypothetical protein
VKKFIIIIVLFTLYGETFARVEYKGKFYRTREIGETEWLIQDLGGNGMGYKWNTAKNICPKGWHLPSNNEWRELNEIMKEDRRLFEDFVRNSSNHWWSSTSQTLRYAHLWFSIPTHVELGSNNLADKLNEYSVRCVKTKAPEP